MLNINTTIEDMMMNNEIDDVILVTLYKCGHESKYYATYDDNVLESSLTKYIKYEIVEDYQIAKKMISDKALIVYEAVESKCSECWLIKDIQKIYCDEQVRPTGFENITKYHGLAAFTGEYTMESAINNLRNLIAHPEYQICCSTSKCGNIGVIVEADVLVASNADLWTYIEPETNRRYYEYDPFAGPYERTGRAKWIINSADELDSSVWEHDEIVTTNNKIKAIWLKDSHSFTNDELALLVEVSKELNIEIINL